LQNDKLFHRAKQEEDQRKIGDEKTLQKMQKAYNA
jgi:hypothetical protein